MFGFVINYCSNEKPFIEPLLRECSKLSSEIVVSYGSHLYDGTPEEKPIILQSLFPHVKLVEYTVDCSADLSAKPGVGSRPTAYWHNLARWMGVQAMGPHVDWIFLLDADEIPDAASLQAWLRQTPLSPRCAYRFAAYWYFKYPTHQATSLEESMVLVHRSALTIDTLFHDIEREWLMRRLRPVRMIGSTNPMSHHYSWVRDRAGIATKLRTWAHRDDRYKGATIEDIVQEIFKDDAVNDIVHGYSYKVVANQFNIRFE